VQSDRCGVVLDRPAFVCGLGNAKSAGVSALEAKWGAPGLNNAVG
jgi:hypothetical protein